MLVYLLQKKSGDDWVTVKTTANTEKAEDWEIADEARHRSFPVTITDYINR